MRVCVRGVRRNNSKVRKGLSRDAIPRGRRTTNKLEHRVVGRISRARPLISGRPRGARDTPAVGKRRLGTYVRACVHEGQNTNAGPPQQPVFIPSGDEYNVVYTRLYYYTMTMCKYIYMLIVSGPRPRRSDL